MKKLLLAALALVGAQLTFAQTSYTFFDNNNRVDDAIIIDSEGNVFGSHYSGNSVFKIDAFGNADTFATGLNTPNGLAFDSQGNLFVADLLGGQVLKYDQDGTLLDTFVVNSPSGLLKANGSDTILISAYYSNIIYKLAPDGTLITWHNDGLLDGPIGMAYDSAGQLYVANFDGNQVLRVLSDTLEYVAKLPDSTAIDYLGFITYARGYLWATGLNSSIIYKIDPEFVDSIWAFAGDGPGYVNGPIDSARFNQPNGITFDDSEELMYVSEFGSGRVRVIAFSDSLLSVKELTHFDMKLYPNPATDVLHISSNEIEGVSAQLLDVQGRIIQNIGLTFGENQLNVSELNSGVYFLKLSNQTNQIEVKRIVIE